MSTIEATTCDHCGKTVPNPEGWVAIETIGETMKDGTFQFEDEHMDFCCRDCLIKWINENLWVSSPKSKGKLV